MKLLIKSFTRKDGNMLSYLKSRFILSPLYNLWVWIGNRRWNGNTLFHRYEHMEKLKIQLKEQFTKMKNKYPERLKDIIV
jgi:hypothetical protein